MRFATFMLPLLTLVLPALAAPVSPPPQPTPRALHRPHPRIRWNTEFPEVILGGSEIDLSWEGGSGRYEIYYIPTVPGDEQPEMLPHVPIATTKQQSMRWKAPELSAYPAQTTLILIIRDAKPSATSKRSMQFDASRSVSLVETEVYRKYHLARRAM